jgi:ubiquinone biosynthesis protein
MFESLQHIIRLIRAGRTLARYDALAQGEHIAQLPPPARLLLRLARMSSGFSRRGLMAGEERGAALSAALATLGPSYIKLGQFLATRPDMIGADAAADLSSLQDRLPPFEIAVALDEIRRELKAEPDSLFAEIGEPVAAASIAQVHRATTREADGTSREVAIKVLRPGIEERFATDLSSFMFAARMAERWHGQTRRLRPVEAVATLARSVELEMDLRMEAAAISEMAQNVAEDDGFEVPAVDWQRTARRVLTLTWVDGTPLSDTDQLRAAGHDLNRLGDAVIQHFLRHAMRDGFFHADMHQGNLFVDADGTLVAVDLGIMGRLSPKDRRFLAEILHGFITRDYERVSQVHFDAGYVPAHHSPLVFAQALRAIGEPLMDREAEEISMARLLGQLFQVTEQFDMEAQPQLLLLQKTMVVVEGVARMLNPRLNMWVTAQPVVEEWMQSRLGPEGRLQDASDGAASVGRFMSDLPELLAGAGQAAHLLGNLASEGGLRLDRHTTDQLAAAQARQGRSGRVALWVAAVALAALAIMQIW